MLGASTILCPDFISLVGRDCHTAIMTFRKEHFAAPSKHGRVLPVVSRHIEREERIVIHVKDVVFCELEYQVFNAGIVGRHVQRFAVVIVEHLSARTTGNVRAPVPELVSGTDAQSVGIANGQLARQCTNLRAESLSIVDRREAEKAISSCRELDLEHLMLSSSFKVRGQLPAHIIIGWRWRRPWHRSVRV